MQNEDESPCRRNIAVSTTIVLWESNRLNFAKTMLARMGNIKAGNLEDPETGENLKIWALAA